MSDSRLVDYLSALAFVLGVALMLVGVRTDASGPAGVALASVGIVVAVGSLYAGLGLGYLDRFR